MLNRTNQYLFPDALSLPDDAEVLNIIGTTYSCSLEMIVAIILWSDGQSRAFADLTPPEQLKSLFELAGKTKIWCNRGNTRLHGDASELLAMLDETLLEVKPGEAMTSFHPKFLLIRYRLKHDNSTKYRIVITSRNFITSDSWDVIFVVEAMLGKQTTSSGKNIAEFVRTFHNHTIEPEMLQEIERLTFDLDTESKGTYGNLRFAFQAPNAPRNMLVSVPPMYSKALVVSPFVGNGFMEEILKRCHGKTILVSMQDSLDKLAPEIVNNPNCDVWSVDGEVEQMSGTEPESPQSEENYSFSLHAKVYQFELDSGSQFFLGSPNATVNGWYGRNTECGIMFDRTSYSIDDFWRETFRKDDKTEVSFLHKYTRLERKKNDEAENLDAAHSMLCSLEIVLTIDTEKREYSISIPNAASLLTSIENFGYEIRISTLHMKMAAMDPIPLSEFRHSPQVRQYNSSASVMPFVEIGIYKSGFAKKKFLLRATLNGDLIESEEKVQTIIRSIITDSSKFFAYLRMLIGSIVPTDAAGRPPNDRDRGAGRLPGSDESYIGFTLEDLLLFLAREPEQVDKVDRFVSYCKGVDSLKEYAEVNQFLLTWEQLKTSFNS